MNRIEIIKAAAEKAAKKAEFKRRQKFNSMLVRKWTDEIEVPRRRAEEEVFDEAIAKLDENYNHWTDGEKYAETHYGDVMRNTTREWDD